MRRMRNLVGAAAGALAVAVVVATTAVAVGVGLTAVALWGVDDHVRGRLAGGILTALLPGTFRVGPIEVADSLRLRVHDAFIDAPEGNTVIAAREVTARLVPAALGRGRLCFDDVVVRGARVEVVRQGPGRLPIERAFVPQEIRALLPWQQPAQRRGLRLVLAHIVVHGVDLHLDVPPLQIDARDIEVEAAELWVQGVELALSARLAGTLTLVAGRRRLPAQPFHLVAGAIHHQFAVDARQVRAAGVKLTLPGITAATEGTLSATDRAVTDFSARVELTAAAAAPWLQALLPAPVRKGLAGELRATALLGGSGGVVRAQARAHGDGLRWRHVPLAEARLHASLVGDDVSLREARALGRGLDLAACGRATLLPAPGTLVGVHDLRVVARRLALRQIIGPFALAPGLLPLDVRFEVGSHGRSLWPMTATAEVDLTARGMPPLPFMPDPFAVRGILLTHPDAIEILRLRLGDAHRHLTLQGLVPLAPQGVLEIYRRLHAIPDP